MTDTLWIIYLTFVGAALGSFLNVCIYRWPAGESVVRPRSRCPGCGEPIAWYDNIPVLSWLILRGRCRRCGTRISVQYPAIELAVALIWLGMALWHGPGVEAVRGAIFLTILLGIAIIDGRHRIIPDQLSLGGAAVGLGLAAWPGGFEFVPALIGAGSGTGRPGSSHQRVSPQASRRISVENGARRDGPVVGWPGVERGPDPSRSPAMATLRSANRGVARDDRVSGRTVHDVGAYGRGDGCRR